jgi:hypothetical protein
VTAITDKVEEMTRLLKRDWCLYRWKHGATAWLLAVDL